LGSFLLLFCWIYLPCLYLAPLLLPQCPCFVSLLFSWILGVLAYSIHTYSFFFLYIHLIFLLHLFLSSSHDILSSIWFSLLERLLAKFFIWLKTLFISRASIFLDVLCIYLISLSFLSLSSLLILALIYLYPSWFHSDVSLYPL
jgi:hypothetical protein